MQGSPAPLRKRAWRRASLAIVATAWLLAGCASGPAANTPASGAAPVSPQPKIIHMAFAGEPPSVVMYGFPSGATAPHVERWLIFHSGLTMWDFDSHPVPRIAAKVPSIQDGDWRINAD